MDLKLLPIPSDKPKEFLTFCQQKLKLSSGSVFKLYYLTFSINCLCDTPVVKFLERTLPHVKIDEIKKHNYLITMPVSTARSLFLEHLDLKFSKILYLYLSGELPPEFLKGCEPKHAIISSQDLRITLLSEKEKSALYPALRAKHQHYTFELEGTCEEIISLLPSLSLYVLKRQDAGYKVFFSLSIAEFIVLYREFIMIEGLSEKVEALLGILISYAPECFG